MLVPIAELDNRIPARHEPSLMTAAPSALQSTMFDDLPGAMFDADVIPSSSAERMCPVCRRIGTASPSIKLYCDGRNVLGEVRR